MPILRIGRATWLLPVLLLATPMLLPLAGREDQSPPRQLSQPEPAEITNIVYRIIANEWQVRYETRGLLSSHRDVPSVLSSRTLNWATLPRTMITFWAG